jgi:hypothetical protein
LCVLRTEVEYQDGVVLHGLLAQKPASSVD